MNKLKIGVVSLGCDKNRVDTEVMLGRLTDCGFEITSDPSLAEIIIVNTCAFLESSRKESIDTVLEMARYKKTGKCKKIIVTGCLGQKFGDEVYKYLTEADSVVGTDEYDRIEEIVRATLQGQRGLYISGKDCITAGRRVLTTLPHVAYLKIADGCDNFCSYCLIPYIRGRYRSRKIEDIAAEAAELASTGVKELILVAQDTTRYGKDIYGEYRITDLIQKLSEIEGVHWIRLLYCYPELTDDRLIEEICRNPKVVKYADIPLQHVSDSMLKKMNRRSDASSIRILFDKLAETSPKIEIRSTFICGFPSETDDTVKDVEEFLCKYKMRNVGFFAYSREKGTAAADFAEQIPKRKKNSIVKKLYGVQKKIMAELNSNDVGKVYEVIIDRDTGMTDNGKRIYEGRTQFMSPDIDGQIYVYSHDELAPGSFRNVKVTRAAEYDLIGEPV